MFEKRHDLNGGRPAPQMFTAIELATVCKLMEQGGMEGTETLIKLRILRDYALQHEQTGRALISLQAD